MIVITAPTSNIGSQVLKTILGTGEPVRVIARDPDRLPAQTRERVEIVQGSHSDADVVNRAFAGADAVFWLVPPDPRVQSAEASYVDFARPGCAALGSADVSRVVGISALGRGWPQNSGYVSATLTMDDLIASTGVSYRALTCPSFMDNVLRQSESIRDRGLFSLLISGDRRLPMCAACDVAAAASKLLLDSTWSEVAQVPILGPEDLSCNEMAQIISEVLGKLVRYAEMSSDALKARLLGGGYTEGMAQAMVAMMAAKNAGMDNLEPRSPQATTPTSFRMWCEVVLKPAVLG